MTSPALVSRTSQLQNCGIAFWIVLILFGRVDTPGQISQMAESEKRAEAQRILVEAQALFNQKTPENSENALKKFRQSAELFVQIGDKRGQAECLVYSGMILENADKSAEAITAYESVIPLAQSVDYKLAEAYALGGLGTIHSKVGENQKAIEYCEKAIPLFKLVGDKRSEASTHSLLGSIYQSLENTNKAITSYLAAVTLYSEVGNKRREATNLNSLGMVYANSGDQSKASEYFQRALPLTRTIADPQLEALVASNLGISYRTLGQASKSLEMLIRASELFRGGGYKKQEALSINTVGLLQLELGDNAKALESFNRSLELSRLIGDKIQEGMSLFNIGGVSEKSRDFRRAISQYEQGLILFREVGAEFEQAIALASIGFAYSNLGEREKALESYIQALALHRKVQNRPGEAAVLSHIGSIFDEIGQLPKAIEYREAAIKIYQALGSRLDQANLLMSIGQTLNKAGDPNGALGYLRKALSIYRELNDRTAESQTLAQIGLIHRVRGEASIAEGLFDESLTICKASGNKVCESDLLVAFGFFLNSSRKFEVASDKFKRAAEICGTENKMCLVVTTIGLGQSLQGLGEYEKSIDKFTRAISVAHSIGFNIGEIGAHNLLGGVHFYLGLHTRAMESYQAALTLSQSIGDKHAEAVSLGNIGMTFFALENYEKALEYQKRALALTEKADNVHEQSTQLNNIGLTLIEKKTPSESILYFTKSLAISRKTENLPNQAMTKLNLGYAYIEMSNHSKALTELGEALRIYRILGDSNNEGAVLGTIALSWYEQKKLNLAAFYGKQALNIIQSQRVKLSGFDLETQKAFISQFEKPYRKLANVFIELGRFAEAEKVLSMLKEEEYFEYLRRDDKVANELAGKITLTPEEQKAFDEYKKYADSLTALGKEYGELQSESKRYEIGQFPKQKRLDELDRLLADATKVFNAFLDDLKNTLGEPGRNDLRVALVESGSQSFLKDLAQPNTVMISTIASEDRLNIIVTTGDSQRAHTVDIKQTDLSKLIFEFRTDIKNPRIDPRFTAKKVYDVLFPASLQKDLDGVKADTIVWSLDGTLRYIPISALWDGQRYLVEKYKNVLITLASRDKLAKSSEDRTKWLALGVGVSKPTTVKETDGTSRNFEALSSVPEELCGLISDPDEKTRCSTMNSGKLGVVSGKSLLDEQFTLQTLRSSLGRYPIVHIASHFSLNTGNENDSYLLLGGGENRKLTLADVRQGGAKFTGVELLTLSACNTAMSTGNRSNGVEIEGFGALAQNQGARSVVASLWPVADTSTRDLMIEFYRQLAKTPRVNKAEAMRLAQISLLNGKYTDSEAPISRIPPIPGDSITKPFKNDPKAPFAHPYYWSPFVLMGNWQ